MAFEEDFPSLKIHNILEVETYRPLKKSCFIDDIQKHCLDKQKVREAIMRLPDDNRRHILMKELKL